MVCAQELTSFGVDMPDNWYKGVTRFSDSLWEMDLTTLSSTELVDIEAQSGRTIDVISLTSNLIDTNLYFQSNRDQTLWMYERVEQ
jgi:hypothetical protein